MKPIRNKKAQVTIGVIVMTFIAVIVGLVLLTDAIADNVASVTNTRTVTNVSVAFPASGITLDLNGRAIEGTLIAYNATGKPTSGSTETNTTALIAAGNFTIENNFLGSDGVLTARLNASLNSVFSGTNTNVTYVNQPISYIPDSGGRALANLVILFTALLIFVAGLMAVSPTIRELSGFGGGGR